MENLLATRAKRRPSFNKLLTVNDAESRLSAPLCRKTADRRVNDLAVNPKTFRARTAVHSQGVGRGYKWLAAQIGMDPKHCHIGEMTADDARRVVDVCRNWKTTPETRNA